MRYDAELKTEDGRTGSYTFEKSYDISAIPLFCGLTVIFFGGACWYYLVMPTVPQENQTHKDALKKLDELLSNSSYEVLSTHIDKMSWTEAREWSDLRIPALHQDENQSAGDPLN